MQQYLLMDKLQVVKHILWARVTFRE